MENKKNKKFLKKSRIIILILAIISIVVLCFLFMPNFKVENPYENTTKISLIVGDSLELIGSEKTSTNLPIIKNNVVYLPFNILKKYVDKNIFWDEDNKTLTITTLKKLIRLHPNSEKYSINYKDYNLGIPIEIINNEVYVPQNFLDTVYHNIKVNYILKNNVVTLDDKKNNITYGKVNKHNQTLRNGDSIKSSIIRKVTPDEEFIILEKKKENKYTKIRTYDGFIGYIKTSKIYITREKKGSTFNETLTSNKMQKTGLKVNLLWDLITNKTANNLKNKRVIHEGVNVLSPTWFSFNKEHLNGDIISLASKDYVDWAHDVGYQVWPLITDSENSKITTSILTDTKKRDKIILNLLKTCKEFDLDGINIDFERVPQDYIEFYLQFLRELTPILRSNGIIVSVDTFVPSQWSLYYNRREIGRVVDYVCVMTYDEYTSASKKSGPNASIGFVENGLKDTIAEIPSDKVIMSIPFFVRVWSETENIDEDSDEKNVNVSVRSVGMNYAYNIFSEEGVNFKWLDDKGCYYGEFEKTEKGKKVICKTWLEDFRSLEEKLKLVKKYDIAGVSEWSRGLQSDGTFELIDSYLG